MKNNGAPNVSLNWFRLSLMLFADEVALVVDIIENLQKLLYII